MKNLCVRVFCSAGILLALSACSPREDEKIYPYNYDPNQDYYLMKDESVDAFDISKAENMALVRESRGKFAPSEGMVFTPLFKDRAANNRQRFERLENEVQILRNDVDVLIPKIFKMAEQQYSESSKRVGNEPIQLKQEEGKTSDLVAVKPQEVYPEIRTVRIADHKDFTRIVIDMNSNIKMKTSISAEGKDLVVNVSDIKRFVPSRTWNALSGHLISGYNVSGSDLHIEAMYPSKIINQSILRPNKDSSYYRFVIDLFSDQVHKK